jgi:hypothetical protein
MVPPVAPPVRRFGRQTQPRGAAQPIGSDVSQALRLRTDGVIE